MRNARLLPPRVWLHQESSGAKGALIKLATFRMENFFEFAGAAGVAALVGGAGDEVVGGVGAVPDAVDGFTHLLGVWVGGGRMGDASWRRRRGGGGGWEDGGA